MTKSFIDVLSGLSGGEIAEDLTAHLTRLAEAVAKNGKKGSVAVTITLTPNGGNSVHVSAGIKSSVPDPVRRQNIMFVDHGGSLTTDNPLQGVFDLTPSGKSTPTLVR